MKKFRIESSRPGYVMYPVDEKLQVKINQHMKDMGERGGPTYFQSFEELEESLPEKKRQLKDLNRGWPITVLLDPWEALHFWGYDAHTITE